MNKEKDFFKTCFNIVASLDVKNESQAIAKEVVLNEIEHLQQENKILKENAEHNDKVVDKVNWENQLLKKENKQLKNNWNKLKEYLETCINIIKKNPIDKRTPFEHSSLSNLGATLFEMQELERGSDNQ